MNIKTRTDLRASLIKSYAALVDLDVETEGSSERDIFVEAPIEGQLIDIWNGLDYLQKLQSPILYESDLLDSDKDKFCRNHGVGSISPTYATGSLVLYTTTKPTQDIYVDSTHQATTDTGSVSFKIVGFYTLPYVLADNYYNALTSRYELTVQIVSLVAGTSGNIASSKITKLSQPITGISGCINTAPTSGGEPAGTLTQRMNLVKQKQKGRNLGNTLGISNFVSNYAADVSIVGSNDALMVRNEGMGGGIDIYVKGSAYEGAVDTVTITSTGLIGVNTSYTSFSIVPSYQPVASVAIFLKNSIALPTSYYTLVKDTGAVRNSTRASDSVMLTELGIANLGYFSPGDSLEVRYNYNALLHNISSALNDPSNFYDNRDYLVYEKSTVSILTYAKIKLYTGYDAITVASSFSSALVTFLDTFSGDYVEFADIVGIIKNTAGVDNMDLSTAYIGTSDNRTKTASGDVPIYDREYPIAGNVTFIPWTY